MLLKNQAPTNHTIPLPIVLYKRSASLSSIERGQGLWEDVKGHRRMSFRRSLLQQHLIPLPWLGEEMHFLRARIPNLQCNMQQF